MNRNEKRVQVHFGGDVSKPEDSCRRLLSLGDVTKNGVRLSRGVADPLFQLRFIETEI